MSFQSHNIWYKIWRIWISFWGFNTFLVIGSKIGFGSRNLDGWPKDFGCQKIISQDVAPDLILNITTCWWYFDRECDDMPTINILTRMPSWGQPIIQTNVFFGIDFEERQFLSSWNMIACDLSVHTLIFSVEQLHDCA